MENEYIEPASVKKVAMKWGLILGLVTVAISMVWQFAGIAGESWTGWVNLLPLIIIMVMAHKEFKETGDSFMSYGQGLGIATLMSLVAGAIGSAFSYIYISFVDDSVIKQSMDNAYESWEAQGMSDAQIEQAEKFTEIFMNPAMMAVMALLFTVFFGFIIALIVSAVTKNSRPEFG